MGYYNDTNIGNRNETAESNRRQTGNRRLYQAVKTEIKERIYLFLFKVISLTALIAVLVIIGNLRYDLSLSHMVLLSTLLFSVVFVSIGALLFILKKQYRPIHSKEEAINHDKKWG